MRKRRFSEQQIVKILGEAKGGKRVKDICRKHGISDAAWRRSVVGLAVTGFTFSCGGRVTS